MPDSPTVSTARVPGINTRSGGRIFFARVGGKGPPRYCARFSETHVMWWHRVAPQLADRFTRISCDMRVGWSDMRRGRKSDKDQIPTPSRDGADDHRGDASNSACACALAGHDRGGSVALGWRRSSRPVSKIAVLDILQDL